MSLSGKVVFVVRGMSKAAVVASYGIPNQKNTRSLDENVWIYFVNRRTKLKIYFFYNDMTARDEVESIDLLRRRRGRTDLTGYPHPRISKPNSIGNVGNAEYRLVKNKQLFAQGIITEEEYQDKRRQIIDGL